MIAKIKSLNENCPDPATGKTYGRELVEIDKIKDFLNYPDKAGNTMIDDAIRMANLYLLTWIEMMWNAFILKKNNLRYQTKYSTIKRLGDFVW